MCILKAGPSMGPNPVTGKGIMVLLGGGTTMPSSGVVELEEANLQSILKV